MNLMVMKIFLILFGIIFLASCADRAAVSQEGGLAVSPASASSDTAAIAVAAMAAADAAAEGCAPSSIAPRCHVLQLRTHAWRARDAPLVAMRTLQFDASSGQRTRKTRI